MSAVERDLLPVARQVQVCPGPFGVIGDWLHQLVTDAAPSGVVSIHARRVLKAPA